MAEYRDHYDQIRQSSANVAGLSVDESTRSEAVRLELQLPFPILCDTARKVVTEWGLLNPREKGGIARPAVFVIDSDRRILASPDNDATRVSTDLVVNFLLSGMPAGSLKA